MMDVTDPQHSAAAAVVFAHKARRGTALISLPNESRTCQMLEKEEHVREGEGEYDGVPSGGLHPPKRGHQLRAADHFLYVLRRK